MDCKNMGISMPLPPPPPPPASLADNSENQGKNGSTDLHRGLLSFGFQEKIIRKKLGPCF